jgi:hypothetical protein
MLKLKSSKQTLNNFKKNRFPQNCRNNIKDPRFKLGIKECIDKKLIDNYRIMQEKDGEYIARIKFTVIVRNKPILIVGRSADTQLNKIV